MLKMHTVYRKVQAVETVFRKLDKHLAAFAKSSGLSCLSGCGKCCHKPDIEATPLEFLPFAYHCFKEGAAMEWYEKMNENREYKICVLLHRLQPDNSRGWCSNYQYRGMICRLFGYSAMRDKYSKPRLLACKPMKEEIPERIATAQQIIDNGANVPFTRDYYFQLMAIDQQLGQQFVPVNKAITLALEHVLGYYSYRPGGHRAS